MAKPNKTRYALLGFLLMQDATGYDIKKLMERSTNNFWRETDSSIYPILKQ
jgi:DNA-binding PadR family transcriptional regulator